jgi:hypothetical protein
MSPFDAQRRRAIRLRLDALEDRAAPDSLADLATVGTLGNIYGESFPIAAIAVPPPQWN